MKEIVPDRLFEHEDKHGKWYELAAYMGSPTVEVFPSKESICIRQENHSGWVDMIELNHGQAYDLLMAISKSLDIPVKS